MLRLLVKRPANHDMAGRVIVQLSWVGLVEVSKQGRKGRTRKRSHATSLDSSSTSNHDLASPLKPRTDHV